VPSPPDTTPATGGSAILRGALLAAVSALAVARLLVLARLLGPDDFGVFAIAAAVLALAASLTDPGIAATLALHPEPAPRELDAGWTIGVLRGALVAAALAAWAEPLAAIFREPRAAPILRGLALVPLVLSFASIGTVALIRRFEFRRLATVQLADALVNTVVAIALAATAGVWALVQGALAGAVAGVAASYVVAPRVPRPRFERASTGLVAFGGWLLASGALAAAIDFTLRLTVARRYGTGPLGVFALAWWLALLPVGIASEVLRAVSLPLYAKLAHDLVPLRRTFRTLATGLAIALVPAYGVLAAGAAGIAEHLLDARWIGIAPVIRVMAIACALGVLGQAAVPLFQGLGLSRLVAGIEVLQLVVVAAAAGVLTSQLGITGAAVAWLGATAVSLVASRAVLHRLLGVSPQQRHRIGVIAAAGAVAAIVTLTVPLVLDGLRGVVGGLAAGLAVSAFVLWRADRSWRLEIGADLVTLAKGGRLTGARY
jgi:O-antigen/teichoic acid export membrane protein